MSVCGPRMTFPSSLYTFSTAFTGASRIPVSGLLWSYFFKKIIPRIFFGNSSHDRLREVIKL